MNCKSFAPNTAARRDLGTNWLRIGIAAVVYGIMMCFELQYWRHLSIATLTGVTELSQTVNETGKLLREEIYARVRHPRYVSAGLGMIGNVLFINFLGLYILFLLVIPIGLWVLALEERELVDRFGDVLLTTTEHDAGEKKHVVSVYDRQ